MPHLTERSFIIAALCACVFAPSAFAAADALTGADEAAVAEARQPFMEVGRYAKGETPSVLMASASTLADEAKLMPRPKPSASLLEDLSVVKNAGAAGALVNVPVAMIGAANWGMDKLKESGQDMSQFLIPAFGQIMFAIGVVIVAIYGVFSMLGNLGAAVSEAANGNFGMKKKD